jgi:hypothetical protein
MEYGKLPNKKQIATGRNFKRKKPHISVRLFVIPLGFPDKNRDLTSHPSFCIAKKKTTFSCCLLITLVIPLGCELSSIFSV